MKQKYVWPLLLVLLLNLVVPLVAQAQTPGQTTIKYADPAFEAVWKRADSLVLNSSANRSWLWGNNFVLFGFESYNQAAGGVRRVQYFDKARMEINDPYGNSQERFFVTNGLLARELISGRVALGDKATEVEIRTPADTVAIAGDAMEVNADAPTYATFRKVASLANDNRTPSALNTGVATNTINKAGVVGTNPNFATTYSGLKIAYYEDTLGHNIPEAFWNFLNTDGDVLDASGKVVKAKVMDWVRDVGLPLTEAYWTKAKVAGKEQDVMVQAFERRVLTYTPANPAAFRVEMGNVGQHYFNWRYQGKGFPASPTAYPLLRQPHAQPGLNAEVFSHTEEVNSWLKDLNVRWVRQQIRWSALEPTKGQFIFDSLDKVVNSMSTAGNKLMLSIVSVPKWASPDGTIPTNPQDFGNFVSALATRYKGKVAAYEIWNEQNLAHEAGKPIEVGRYVQLLKAGYEAIKKVDLFTVVVCGGLSPVGFIDVNIAVDDVQYLKLFYAYNKGEAKQYFDVLGAHPGSNNNPPDALWPESPGPGPGWINDPSFYFRRIEQLRRVMEEAGDGTKQIWLTEFGWDSTSTPPPGYEYARQISEEQQAQYIARAFEKSYKEYPWMGVMLLWQLNFALPTVTSNPDDEKNGWGILRRDGSKRPSYLALQNYARTWPQ